jgi:hypothetical protein
MNYSLPDPIMSLGSFLFTKVVCEWRSVSDTDLGLRGFS